MKRILQSLVGVALIGVGVAVTFLVEGRGDTLVIFFVGLGGFFVSKSLIGEFFEKVWGTIRGGGS